jgi:hypothetical protein
MKGGFERRAGDKRGDVLFGIEQIECKIVKYALLG